jgi:hypothetical protein
MSVINEHEMRRATRAHEAMKRALYTLRPPLNTREAMLALQATVAAVIVDSYMPEWRDEMCQEHAKQVKDSVQKLTEANLGRKT